MSINYAILGILSFKPSTGYDLKKIIQESPFMYWSGNNNQIYKSLVELLDEGLVASEVHHQDSSPSKKVYTITEEGLVELKNWVLSTPEGPEIKKMFLIQLAWSHQLSTKEIASLLSEYEGEIRMQIIMNQQKRQKQTFAPNRTTREIQVWDLIYDNINSSYENELNWIQKVRNELCMEVEEMTKMSYKVIEANDSKYILCDSAETPLCSEQEALDLIGACFEHNIRLIMIDSDALTDDFYKLRTGLAGQVLQKFINYQIKVAVVLTNEKKIKGKFKDFIDESNKGNTFRVFDNSETAANWLIS